MPMRCASSSATAGPSCIRRTYADGIPTGLHRTTNGDVCLWEDGDPSLGWLTWDGISQRIEGVGARGSGHRIGRKIPASIHTSTSSDSPGGLATIDLTRIAMRDWMKRDLRRSSRDEVLGSARALCAGGMYMRDQPHLPARTLEDLGAALRVKQRRDLERRLEPLGNQMDCPSSFWPGHPAGHNLLVSPGPSCRTDGSEAYPSMRLRAPTPSSAACAAGPAATALLAEKTVRSVRRRRGRLHVADLLTRSGVGVSTSTTRSGCAPGT